jgi:hypothetical protein
MALVPLCFLVEVVFLCFLVVVLAAFLFLAASLLPASLADNEGTQIANTRAESNASERLGMNLLGGPIGKRFCGIRRIIFVCEGCEGKHSRTVENKNAPAHAGALVEGGLLLEIEPCPELQLPGVKGRAGSAYRTAGTEIVVAKVPGHVARNKVGRPVHREHFVNVGTVEQVEGVH